MSYPLVIGHRGARGLFAENTLAGFAGAIALGIDGLELDVAVTADGVPVVSHDPRLDPNLTRGPDGQWLEPPTPLIRSLRFTDLQAFDVGRPRPGSAYAAEFPQQQASDGARIPRLAEIFALGRDIRLFVEMKTFPTHPERAPPPAEMADLVARAIIAADAAARAVVLSFDWRGLRHLHKHHPGVATGWLTRKAGAPERRAWWDADPHHPPWEIIAREGGPYWLPEFGELDADNIARTHRLGVAVIPWKLQRSEEMAQIIDWGADGMIVDRPDLALAIRRQKSSAAG
jgi:glycerophosphoryl diester phosphodiesterase